MNSLRHILLVAYRDFMQRAKSRAFLISIVVIIGLLAAVGPLLAFEMRDPAPYDIGTLGSQPEGLSGALAASAGAFDRSVEVTSYVSLEEGEAAVESGRADVLIVDGAELVWNEEPSLR